MPRLEELANVALRVPSILVLDLLYKCDIDGLTDRLKAKNEDMLFKYKYLIWNMYYIGHLVNVVVLILPLRHIVTLYLHVLAALLLYMGHQISKDYVREELQYDYEGPVYLDSLAFNRFVSAMTSQIILSTLCAFLMKTRKVWLFSAHLLPLLARFCALPHATLLTVNTFSMGLTGAGATVFLLSHLFLPYRLARTAYSELVHMEVFELYRLLAVGISLWNRFAVPVLFSVFWFVLFIVQLCSDTMNGNASLGHQGIMFFLLTSVSECCATPYSLLGLTFVVSYLALGLLNLCKFYLGGYAAVQNENVMHRGVTEGVTLLLLALQTGLLDMQALQRTFLLSIILFIVVTSTLQSMIEIADPVILALGASRNRSVWKHFRGLSMCLLLLVFPVFMAYKISQFFHMDFWLLILVSSCMLTSLQVTGTMLIYSLFMVELFRADPIESLDEVIYWVNAVSRVLEFLVALCVVAYGAWESLFGEWSWMGASVIIIHSYFNVWLRAQSGWRSFLLRQEAAKKINSLPRATTHQLQQHNDVCSICFQEMSSAVITYCGHFFHGNCLRKWLYVQETCPMCHQAIRPTLPGRAQASGGAPSADAEPPAQEKHQNEDNEVSQETQAPLAMPDPTELQEEMEIRCGTNHQPVEPQGDDHNHFNPRRDFSWSCTSGATLRSGVHKTDEEGVGESPLPSSPDAANQNSQAEITETDFKLNGVPQSDNGESESCVEAPSCRERQGDVPVLCPTILRCSGDERGETSVRDGSQLRTLQLVIQAPTEVRQAETPNRCYHLPVNKPVPQSDNGESESCVEAPGSQSGSKSHDSSNTSLFNSQTDNKSLKENLEDDDDTQSYSD